MADNAPAPEGTPQPHALPTAPPLKPSGPGKVVVLLSSVAKAPPARPQTVPPLTPDAGAPKPAPLRPSLQVVAPPPVPLKHPSPEVPLVRPGGSAEAKLPPPIVPAPPQVIPVTHALEARPLPAIPKPDLVRVPANASSFEKSGSKKTTARLLIPKIKIGQPVPEPVVEVEPPRESIILGPGDEVTEHPIRPKIVSKAAPTPEPVVEAKPEVKPPAPESVPVSEPVVETKPESKAPTPEPTPVLAPVAEIKPEITPPVSETPPALPTPSETTPATSAAPALIILPPIGAVTEISAKLQPPVILSEPPPTEAKPASQPPPLPLPKPLDKSAPSAVHVVPKMVGSEPVVHAEKLPPPQLHPPELLKPDAAVMPASVAPAETKAILRIPALVPVDSKPSGTPPPALPSKTEAKTSPESKVPAPILQRDNVAVPEVKIVPPPLPETTVKALSKPEEGKPALRPAVLPNKILKASEAASSLPSAPPPLEKVPADNYERFQPHDPGKLHAPVELPAKPAEKSSVLPTKEKLSLPPTRVERAKKRRLVEMIIFYIIMLGVGAGLYFGTIYFTKETRVEGQVIPPTGMPLADEVWIVSDFRQLTSGIAEDVAEERAPLLQEMRERQDHVQRVQADIAMREEKIRLLQAQIQACKDEETNIVKEARDAAQKLWDGPGAELDDDYNSRQNSLQNAIANRAKSLGLKYAPDPTYNAPEVWANAYRLALYEVPKGVDGTKEYAWLNDQMKAWRDFVKGQDDKREQLREQAAQIKMAPASKLTDLNAKIDDLQHRIDGTQTEEEPLKPELQQAQADLAETQTEEGGLDAKYYKQLSALPGASITKRLQVETNGRFSWPNLENDSPFSEGETEHHYWIFARATRPDGREYWALGRFSVTKDHPIGILILPDSFVSTKAMLRPDLPPDEQAQ